jgi:hypothetical protein
MKEKLRIPKLPNIDVIIKSIIEKELKAKAQEWAKDLALAKLRSLGGPSAVLNNVDVEIDFKQAKIELPTMIVGTNEHSFSYSIPEVTMKTKVVAKLHIPEVYMQRERLPFNHRHCKTVWVNKRINRWMKTKVPQVTCWETPAYADVPKTRMTLREMKTDIPEVKMKLETVKVDIPSFTLSKNMVSLDVPNIKKITFDFEGAIKDVIPGVGALNAILELIQKAEEFRKELEEKVDSAINEALNPVLEALLFLQEEIIQAIEKIENKYSEINRELQDMAGEHSEAINQIAKEESEKISLLLNQLEPINETINKIDNMIKRAKNLVKSIKLI